VNNIIYLHLFLIFIYFFNNIYINIYYYYYYFILKLPETTVIGPLISFKLYLVYLLTNERINVVLPHFLFNKYYNVTLLYDINKLNFTLFKITFFFF